MRICLVYDRLHPYTVGGAERWYSDIGERLVEQGHDVTYLTLRHWDRSRDPEIVKPGARVVAVGPQLEVFSGDRRSILPPLVFGLLAFLHFLRHGRSYDVVQTASFPYFALLAAGLVRPLHRYGIVVDWHEVWTLDYWREYLGGLGGRVGHAVQRLGLHIPQFAYTPSRMYERRLRDEGFRGEVEILDGRYAGPTEAAPAHGREPLVVFAGRHIPEKRPAAIVPAFALAAQRRPELRLEIFGDGPQREEVRRLIAEHGLEDRADAPGFVELERVEAALGRAMCMVLPSRREGYGLVVVEAAARGTPSVVVAEPDNAATELVDEGENGFVARSAAPEHLAEAILKVYDAGPELQERTARWFERNAERLSLERSLDAVARHYGEPDIARR